MKDLQGMVRSLIGTVADQHDATEELKKKNLSIQVDRDICSSLHKVRRRWWGLISNDYDDEENYR